MKAIIHASQLLTLAGKGLKPARGKGMLDLGIIPDGALIVDERGISRVGSTYSLKEHIDKLAPEDIFDAKNQVVMPGFVDSHTHALFASTREQEFFLRLQGKSYMEILAEGGGILNSRRAFQEASDEQVLTETGRRLSRMLSYGTTTVEIKTGYGLSTESEIRALELIASLKKTHQIQIHATFMGAHALPPEFKKSPSDYVNLVAREMIPIVAQKKLAEFVDVFCEEGVFNVKDTEMILQEGLSHGLRPRLHADEIKSFGATELGCVMGALSVDHLIAIQEGGLKALEKSQTIANLLPGTAYSLLKPYAPAREMIARSIAVALSTDCNPGSCYTESMPMILSLAATQMKMGPEELITASTFNGACALAQQEFIGSLEMGKQADLLVLHCRDYREIPYHFGINPVARTMKKGEWVFINPV